MIRHWQRPFISVLGKITAVKTLLLSKLREFFNFIWDGGPDRISRNQLIQDYADGGLRMVHIPSFVKSLKLTWIRRIFSDEASWKNLIFSELDINMFLFYTYGLEFFQNS